MSPRHVQSSEHSRAAERGSDGANSAHDPDFYRPNSNNIILNDIGNNHRGKVAHLLEGGSEGGSEGFL